MLIVKGTFKNSISRKTRIILIFSCVARSPRYFRYAKLLVPFKISKIFSRFLSVKHLGSSFNEDLTFLEIFILIQRVSKCLNLDIFKMLRPGNIFLNRFLMKMFFD